MEDKQSWKTRDGKVCLCKFNLVCIFVSYNSGWFSPCIKEEDENLPFHNSGPRVHDLSAAMSLCPGSSNPYAKMVRSLWCILVPLTDVAFHSCSLSFLSQS